MGFKDEKSWILPLDTFQISNKHYNLLSQQIPIQQLSILRTNIPLDSSNRRKSTTETKLHTSGEDTNPRCFIHCMYNSLKVVNYYFAALLSTVCDVTTDRIIQVIPSLDGITIYHKNNLSYMTMIMLNQL